MRKIIIIALFLLFPLTAFADCNPDGYTIIFVNGILTDEQAATHAKDGLQYILDNSLKKKHLNVYLGYNPSHLSGLGDGLQSISQAFNAPFSQFDLKTILMQIAPEVTTRKILLVGHSQGTFYTNELYNYLVTHGVPQESIAVYNIATPASFVAGGGLYITSSNDKAINFIRNSEVTGNQEIYANSYYTMGSVVSSALRANITIPQEDGWATDNWGGHHFSVYLDGAADRIVHDIDAELAELKASGDASGACFTPPTADLSYKMQAAALGAADPIAGAAKSLHDTFASYTSHIAGTIASAVENSRGAFAFEANPNQASAAALATETEVPALPADLPKTPAPQVPAKIAEATPAPLVNPPMPAPAAKSAPVPVMTPPAIPPQASTTNPPPQSSGTVSISPGFGGGGSATPSTDPVPSTVSSSTTAPTAHAVLFTVDSPSDNTAFANPAVAFEGTADASALVTASYASSTATTTADASGNWALSLTLAEGTTEVDLGAQDVSGDISPTLNLHVTVDTVAPATTTLSIADCSASLTVGFCGLPGTSTTLSWSAVPEAASYGLAVNGVVIATTTSLSETASFDEGATTTFAVVTYDTADNAATSSSIDVYGLGQAAIINEIGWAGVEIDRSRQWIEVRNMTPFKIDLSHLAIERSGEAPIQLSGTVTAGIHYVVIRAAPFTGTVTSLAFTLSTSTAEQLTLVWNSELTLDATPPPSACTGWCAGAFNEKLGSNVGGVGDLFMPLSMERKDNTPDGASPSSWQSTDSYTVFIVNSGEELWGTPGHPNSHGFPDVGVYCGSPTNLLTTQLAPYNPGTGGCEYLSRFITGRTRAQIVGGGRAAGLFRGDVGSSTNLTGYALSYSLAGYGRFDAIPADATPGEHFFFAIWEGRNGPAFHDGEKFMAYFTVGASTTAPLTPPHGNYAVLPFIYQP
jgi:hypothetical protein